MITITKTPSQYGWTCPKCERVWAPWVKECEYCNPKDEHYTPNANTVSAYNYYGPKETKQE